jgi:glycosyltransferase involved in cell wall biosynthesis
MAIQPYRWPVMRASGHRRVLLLAYHFPPVGGAGAQRALHLVRHLDELGFEPIVVTSRGDRDGRFNPRDEALSLGLPARTRVLRVPGLEPHVAHGAGWRVRGERLTGMPDSRTRWWIRGTLRAAAQINGGIDLIHAFLEPYETAFAASRLARRFGVPWIADLQDPWALDETRVHITHIHRLQDRWRMQRVLRTASTIVMNTPEAACALGEELPGLVGKPLACVPNGFDAAEWRGPDPVREAGVLRIVHTGTLHTEVGLAHRRSAHARRLLGGRVAPVDMLTRSHVFLLEAVESLMASRPDLTGRLEILLAGVLTPADLEVAARYPFVRPLGFRPHHETVNLIRSADLLFLPMHDLPAGRRARLVPCKTYEYLASGRPILAAVPDGDARDLLAGQPGVHLCRPAEVAEMGRVVAALMAGDRQQSVDRLPRLARYERGALAAELAGLYRAVLPASTPSLRTAARSSLPPEPPAVAVRGR